MEIIVTQTDPLVRIEINNYPIPGQDQVHSLEENPSFNIDEDADYLVMKNEEGGTLFGLSQADVGTVSVNGSGGFTTVEQVRDAIIALLPNDSGGSGDMLASNNLSELTNKPTARINLGLYDYQNVTVAQLQVLIPVVGVNYKVTDPVGGSNPIYITYEANKSIQQGVIEIYNATLDETFYCYVDYSWDAAPFGGEDRITKFFDPLECNAIQGLPDANLGTANTIATIISHIANKEGPVIAYNNLSGAGNELNLFDIESPTTFFYGNNLGDDNIITVGTAAQATFLYNYFWWRNTVVINDGADVQHCLFYNYTTVTVGAGTILLNCRFYDGVILSIPAGKSYNITTKTYEAKPGTNTFNDALDVLADTTPDLATVAWAGEIELTATGASISLTQLQNLAEGFVYKISAAAGKTITFTNGATIKNLGAADFVCVGSSNDFIIYKVIGGVPTAQYQAKH